MGQKISLVETFTGGGLPTIYDDQIMSAGSLLLHDLGHSLGGVTGIPGNSALVPNVAWATANALVQGTPGQAALSSMVITTEALVTGPTGSASYPYAERTPKNGLHLIKSQANDVNGKSYYLSGAAAILAYLVANSTHSFYMSVWHYVTRGAAAVGTPFPGKSMIGMNSANNLMSYVPATLLANSIGGGSAVANRASAGAGALIYNVTGAAMVQWEVTAPIGSTTNWALLPFIFGGTGGPFSGFRVGDSGIFYRCYLEDLTVSASAGGYAANGAITVPARYAELAARDMALYNTAFSSVGKFYGDTFTSPASYA